MKKLFSYLLVATAAILLAFVYYVFIVTNNFAPAGLNGIATMVQYKTGFSISYMSLLINIPLSTLAYFFVQKDFAKKTLLFSLVYSFSFLFLQNSRLSFIQYNALGHDTIYPVILSGVLSGIVYGTCIRNNASTGGSDIISRYINKIRPDTNFFIVTFTLNALVSIASVFVYSTGELNYKPATLCILYCFISSYVGNLLLKRTKTAYKFTIITSRKEEIVAELLHTTHHGCTVLDAIGAYTDSKKAVLICVINKNQINDLQHILSKYNDTFSYFEVVNETYGNFKKIKQKNSKGLDQIGQALLRWDTPPTYRLWHKQNEAVIQTTLFCRSYSASMFLLRQVSGRCFADYFVQGSFQALQNLQAPSKVSITAPAHRQNPCVHRKKVDCPILDTQVSGSPIIQDGKLVGAVTHVLVNDPTTGYGIFIENMLDAAS